MEVITLNMDNIKGNLYMGLDCSSKAIHCVWVDDQERFVAECKWGSKKNTFEERFLDFCVDFWDSLSKIKVTLNDVVPVQAAVEAALQTSWTKPVFATTLPKVIVSIINA